MITENFYPENNTDLNKKHLFSCDLNSSIKNENIDPIIKLNVFNSTRSEEKEITYDLVNKMKTYFSSYFFACSSIITEIFSVKKNTIQHPIYAFRGSCFICNQRDVKHIKDERAIDFLAKKYIKLLKNMNVFSLLDNQSYIEDESFSNTINYNFYDEDIEMVMNNRNNEIHNSAHLATEENIDEENIPIYNNTEKFIYSSFYSDSNFEFAKSNYRNKPLNINTIKEEIKHQVEILDEQFNKNYTPLNRYVTKGQYNVNLHSYDNKNMMNKNTFYQKRNSIISNNNRNLNKSKDISIKQNYENNVASKNIQETFSFGKNSPDLYQHSQNSYKAQLSNLMNIKRNFEFENEYCLHSNAERLNRYTINRFGQSSKNEYTQKRNLSSCNSNKIFDLKNKEYNNIIREENSIHSLHSENNLTISKIINTKKINLIMKSQSQNTLIGDYIQNTFKNTHLELSRASSISRQINLKRFSIVNPFENYNKISNYSNNSSKKQNFIRMTTINFKRPISLNFSGRIRTEQGGRFSIKYIKEKHNLYFKKENKKLTPDEKEINKQDKKINQNSNTKRYSNQDFYQQQNAINSTSDIILKNDDHFKNKSNLNYSNRKLNRNFKSKVQSNKKKPLIKKFYKGDFKGVLIDNKNHKYFNNFCEICLSSIQFENTSETLGLSCGHFYCLECIKEYIKDTIIKLNSRNVKTICKCPKPVCCSIIPIKDIEEILKDDKKNFEIFYKCLIKIDNINNLNNIIICPIPDCESYAKREMVGKNLANCEKNHFFCVKCRKAKHSGHCQRLSSDDLATEKYLKNNSCFKKCPKCMTYLYKFSECNTNVVRCGYKLCDYEYCWICGRIREKTHYTNPLSSCYKLEKIDSKHVLATNDCLRMTKYFLIVLLTMLLIPFLIIFSTFLFSTFYILAFVPDGSAVKHIKMQKRDIEPIFKFFVSGIYFWIAFPLVPLGYLLQGTLIVLSPFIYLYKKLIKY